jgi:hypothetical protein
MSFLSKAAGSLLGSVFAKKANKGSANELAAMSPFNPFQQQAMANLYHQRATEDPRLAAQRNVDFAQEAQRPQLRDMSEQFSANVGRRLGTGGTTTNAGFMNELAGRQFNDVFRQGGLANLGAINDAYAGQLQALRGGLDLQQGFNQTLGQASVNDRNQSRTDIPMALGGILSNIPGREDARRREEEHQARVYAMKTLGLGGAGGQSGQRSAMEEWHRSPYSTPGIASDRAYGRYRL